MASISARLSRTAASCRVETGVSVVILAKPLRPVELSAGASATTTAVVTPCSSTSGAMPFTQTPIVVDEQHVGQRSADPKGPGARRRRPSRPGRWASTPPRPPPPRRRRCTQRASKHVSWSCSGSPGRRRVPRAGRRWICAYSGLRLVAGCAQGRRDGAGRCARPPRRRRAAPSRAAARAGRARAGRRRPCRDRTACRCSVAARRDTRSAGQRRLVGPLQRHGVVGVDHAHGARQLGDRLAGAGRPGSPSPSNRSW